MSTSNLQLITCDRCQRRYDVNVYERHRKENQCLKRNHHRLPFESIKQRSIQIGDRIYSIQRKSKEKHDDVQVPIHREKRKQQLSTNNNNKQYQEKMIPTNHRRQQAKQLLERRTKYQPPWIRKRSEYQTKKSPSKIVDQGIPTTKFKTDDLPVKSNRQTLFSISNRRGYPLPSNSSKKVDQIFTRQQTTSAFRLAHKANTWTRSSKQSNNHGSASPIQIPTFCDSSSGPSHDRLLLPSNQNYDDDEFEPYSPTPPSTPKCKLPNVVLDKQQTIIRPNTYQKAKRSDVLSGLIQPPRYSPTQSIIHLPPIKSKIPLHPRPWR